MMTIVMLLLMIMIPNIECKKKDGAQPHRPCTTYCTQNSEVSEATVLIMMNHHYRNKLYNKTSILSYRTFARECLCRTASTAKQFRIFARDCFQIQIQLHGAQV